MASPDWPECVWCEALNEAICFYFSLVHSESLGRILKKITFCKLKFCIDWVGETEWREQFLLPCTGSLPVLFESSIRSVQDFLILASPRYLNFYMYIPKLITNRFLTWIGNLMAPVCLGAAVLINWSCEPTIKNF